MVVGGRFSGLGIHSTLRQAEFLYFRAASIWHRGSTTRADSASNHRGGRCAPSPSTTPSREHRGGITVGAGEGATMAEATDVTAAATEQGEAVAVVTVLMKSASANAAVAMVC